MANFMGPMAPPQAAQPQPAQLDIKTNPSQRAQFKTFMQGMSRPAAPPTTAPIAPMLPAPSPMDQVDIFAPAPMADGGVVGGLNNLRQMSGDMVEALNTVVYGGGQGMGGIQGGGMSSGGGFGGGQMPPPLPMIGIGPFKGGVSEGSPRPAVMPGNYQIADTGAFDRGFPDSSVRQPGFAGPSLGTSTPLSLSDMSALGMRTPQYMPMDPDGDGMDQSGRPMESQLTSEQLEGFKKQMTGLRSSAADQGSPFGVGSMGSPFARLAGLGSIFGYEDGGAVKMAGGTTNVIDGTRDGTGVVNPISEMDDVDMGFANPPLPVTGLGALMSNLDASMAMQNQPNQAMSNAFSAPASMSGVQNFVQNVMSGAQAEGPLGGTFNVRPTMRGDDLGIMASYNLSFADGGPVGMANGGSPFDYMFDQQREDYSSPIIEEAIQNFQGPPPYEEDPGADAGIDMGTPEPEDDMVTNTGAYVPPDDESGSTGAAFNPRTDRTENQRPGGTISIKKVGESVPDTSSAELMGTLDSGTQNLLNTADLFDISQIAPIATPNIAPDPLLLGLDDTVDFETVDRRTGAAYGDPDIKAFGGKGDTVEGVYSPAERLANLQNLTLKNKGPLSGTNVVDDLETRSKGADAGFSPAGMLAKAAGAGMATSIAKNALSGDPDVFPVIDSSTNQIIGYSGYGGRGYTGRPGYNPITAGLFDNTSDRVRYDEATGAYFVDPLPPGYDSPDPQYDQQQRDALRTATPAQPPAAPPPPNMITRPDNPIIPTPPPDVVVPSPRDPVNIGGAPVLTSPLLTAPNIDPVQSVGLPQSFLDLLAQFNRPAPRAMQDGGAVLDKAADDFLEALRVA